MPLTLLGHPIISIAIAYKPPGTGRHVGTWYLKLDTWYTLVIEILLLSLPLLTTWYWSARWYCCCRVSTPSPTAGCSGTASSTLMSRCCVRYFWFSHISYVPAVGVGVLVVTCLVIIGVPIPNSNMQMRYINTAGLKVSHGWSPRCFEKKNCLFSHLL